MKTKFEITANNFPIICRLCLLPNELLPLNSIDAFKIYKKITSIEVNDDDGLPQNICKICIKLLEEVGLFIEQAKDNYSILLSALNKKIDCKQNMFEYNPENVDFEIETLIKNVQNQNIVPRDNYSDSEAETKPEIGEVFQCAQCEKEFSIKKLLILHIGQEHKTNDVQNIRISSIDLNCDVCKKAFSSNVALEKHKKLHFKKNKLKTKHFKYNCTQCDRILTSQSALDNHMKTHTGDRPYKCLYCDKNFAFSGSLTVHTRIHTGETPYTCLVCNKGYCSSSSLKKHKEKMHFDVEQPEKIENNCNLEDLQKVQCKFCKKMLHKHGYGTHMRIHTNERKTFVCNFCSKQFKKLSHLDRHVRIHTGERPFVCLVCKKPFTQEGDLKRHWVIHSGQKEFQCQHCGKLYFTKSALDTHITNHTCPNRSTDNGNISKKPLLTEHKSFLCTVCGKSFTASNSLKVHIRLHTGDCPFVCTYCEKAYTNATNLKRHVMRNHTLEKPHVCMICHKGFHDSTNLKRHIKRVHSVLEIRDKKENDTVVNEEII